MNIIQPVKGTHDLFGNQLVNFRTIEDSVKKFARIYNFNEIITPIFELTELFTKPLGVESDVVLKEMYTFNDRNNSSLTLRPEYTTPIIRAAISNNLLEKMPQKLYGIGPMFRRERPQKGRYRQFNQINFEILGSHDIAADLELILLADDFLKKIFLNDRNINLNINSLGDQSTLVEFKSKLSDFFNRYKNELSEESKIKVDTNPLRILDSKNSNDEKICKTAPKIFEFYSKDAKNKFDNIQNLLSSSSIDYTINPNLVRGLDYYCHTVFEFKTNDLGSQDTLIGGGRYDGLTKILGGPDIPGVGWAGGVERMMMLLSNKSIKKPKVFLILLDENYKLYGLDILNYLRKNDVSVHFDYKYNLKKSLSLASKEKIEYAIIIGEDEVKDKMYTIKNLEKNIQSTVSKAKVIDLLI